MSEYRLKFDDFAPTGTSYVTQNFRYEGSPHQPFVFSED